MVKTRALEDLSLKMKRNKKHGREVEKVAKEAQGHAATVGVDLRVRSR